MMADFTIVFTTYNDSTGIIPFLDNITQQTLRPKSIIMVDGGSSDDTVAMAEQYASKTSYPLKVISGNRLNIAQGYNTAIRAADTEYIGIVGVGNLYDTYFFEHLMECSLKTNVDISYGLICGQNTTDFAKWYNTYILNGSSGKDSGMPSNHGSLVKKDVLQKVGYFAEDFYYAGEDTEYFLRAMRQGISVKAVDDALLYWETPKTFREYCKQVELYTIANTQIFGLAEMLRRNRTSIRLWVVCILILLGGSVLRSPVFVFLMISLLILTYFLRFLCGGVRGWKNISYCFVAKLLPAFYLIKNHKFANQRVGVI